MFTAAPKAAEHIPSLISGAIRDRFTLEVPILTRSSIEWRALLEANPFLRKGADTKFLHVAFLARRPNKKRFAELDPDRSLPTSSRYADAFPWGYEVRAHIQHMEESQIRPKPSRAGD